ncbi:response regulator FixJ [Pararhizobium haloflavum]|uniref:response regulator FixJ n=1 Tax=Pararhizobium haloflavum TaxID=2037914 RepID=UPI000C18EEF7|nr:response regulator FixJ [Pararhizobium haloflavum]
MGDWTVHIVDDDAAVRDSLAFMLAAAGFAVRTYPNGSEFLSVARSLRHSCLLTDLRMPDMSGVELIRRLKAADAALPAIVITGHGDVPMAVEAMKVGASDFIEKPFDDAVLLEAIARATGERNAPAGDGGIADDIVARLDTLTPREVEVFEAVVGGLPNKTIAHALDISPRTVEVHRANVMTKMQARNLPELVRLALAAGYDITSPVRNPINR